MSGQDNEKQDAKVISLFDRSGEHPEIADGDNRTLRLSVPGLTLEKIDALIAFQRRWIAELRAHPDDPVAMVRSHEAAAAESGLSNKEANELEALARAFSGDAWTLRMMQSRLEQARATVGAAEKRGEAPSPRELNALEKLPKEIRTRQTMQGLERRYGAEAISLLRQREEFLIELHQELNALLRR